MPTHQAQAEATYRKHLPNLQKWSGWFALVRGDRLGGVFPTHAAAAAAWMSMYGPVPALIRRIKPTETAAADASPPPATPAPIRPAQPTPRPVAGRLQLGLAAGQPGPPA